MRPDGCSPDAPWPNVVVATTMAPYKAQAGEATQWLDSAEGMIAEAQRSGYEVSFFAAIESQHAHLVGFERVVEIMNQLEYLGALHSVRWRFSLDDGETKLTSGNRLVRICTGRNLAHEYAARAWCSHIMFLDSDITAPGDIITKLLDVEWPIVGANVPLYNLSGPRITSYPFPVQEHWNTAGALLVSRDVFRRIRWRHDPEAGLTDDPCFAFDAENAGFGKTRVRKDVICSHLGQTMLWPLERRGQDLRIGNGPPSEIEFDPAGLDSFMRR